MFVFWLLALLICLLDFISCLLFNLMYFRFELFDWIFLAGCACVECVVTGMLFTMQTKIQSCNMKGYLKMFILVTT